MKRIAILFLGLSVSGKGTRAKEIQRNGVTWQNLFGSGDFIRDNIKSETELGLAVEGFHDRGEHVPLYLIKNIWEQGISPLRNKNLLLDGCVRDGNQAREFAKFMGSLGYLLHVVIVDTPLSVCEKRITSEVQVDPERSERKDTKCLVQKLHADIAGFREAASFFTGATNKGVGRLLRVGGTDVLKDVTSINSWLSYLLQLRTRLQSEKAA